MSERLFTPVGDWMVECDKKCEASYYIDILPPQSTLITEGGKPLSFSDLAMIAFCSACDLRSADGSCQRACPTKTEKLPTGRTLIDLALEPDSGL